MDDAPGAGQPLCVRAGDERAAALADIAILRAFGDARCLKACVALCVQRDPCDIDIVSDFRRLFEALAVVPFVGYRILTKNCLMRPAFPIPRIPFVRSTQYGNV